MQSPFPKHLDLLDSYSPVCQQSPNFQSSINQSFRDSVSSAGKRRWIDAGSNLREAELEYQDLLKQLEEDESIKKEEIEEFKKLAIIKKSIQEVRRRAYELQQIRCSPSRYSLVKSKVAQNIQVQNRSPSKSKRENSTRASPINKNSMLSSQSQMTQSLKSPQFQKSNQLDLTQNDQEKQRLLNLSQHSINKIQQRELQIMEAEQNLQDLLKQLQDKRPFHLRLRTPNSQQETAFKKSSEIITTGPQPIKDKLDTFIDDLVQNQIINQDVKNCCLLLFNIYKMLTLKSYSLNNWNDVQNHFNEVGHDAIKAEINYVQINIKKLNIKDFITLKNKFSYQPGESNLLIHQLLIDQLHEALKYEQQQQQESQAKQQVISIQKQSPQKVEATYNKIDSRTQPIQNIVTILERKILPNGYIQGGIQIVEARQNKQNLIQAQKEKSSTQKMQVQMRTDKTKTMSANPSIMKKELNNESKQTVNTSQLQKEKTLDNTESKNRFDKKELGQKTEELQNEFNVLLGELIEQRKQRDGEVFYEAMNEFYYNDDVEAHSSPTRRLIQHKNTAVDHKQTMQENIEKGDYSLTYTTSPKRSYIIEPHGGELNYKLAEKNPLKFYDQVFNQDITKHKIAASKDKKNQLTVSSKVTKRPHLKIMDKLKQKIANKLKEKIGEEFGANIFQALQDTAIDFQIKQLIKQDKLKIVDKQNQPVFEKELQTELGIKVSVDDKKKKISQLTSKKEPEEIQNTINKQKSPMNLKLDISSKNISECTSEMSPQIVIFFNNNI